MWAVTTDESAHGPLSELQRAVLALEVECAVRPPSRGRKVTIVRERFGLSETRYLQLVNGLLEHPGAWEAAPATVAQLRRMRQRHVRSRSARRT